MSMSAPPDTIATASPASPPPSAPPPHAARSRTTMVVVAVVVVVVLIVAAVGVYYLYKPAASTSPKSTEGGGFSSGSVVTFVYSGSASCTPSSASLYPSAGAATGEANCEIGLADQNAVTNQVPQWLLVPAYAGLSIFGLAQFNGSSRGFATSGASAILTDCGAGGSPTACPQDPALVYAPLFAQAESLAGAGSGVGGHAAGVLPIPAHDILLNASSSFPTVPWGSIVVMVLDPNILPDRSSGTCSAVASSNLSSPTSHCLVTLTALTAAMTTHASDVATVNAANPIWKALGSPTTQVVLIADPTVASSSNLDSNLYTNYSVQAGAPPLPS